jgi:hypothetical protein
MNAEDLGTGEAIRIAGHRQGHIEAVGAKQGRAKQGRAKPAETLHVHLMRDAVAGAGEVDAVPGAGDLQIFVVIGILVSVCSRL